MSDVNPEGLIDPAEDVLSTVVEATLNEAIGSAGGMLTGFLGLVTFLDDQGNRYYRIVAGAEQNSIISLGMERMLRHQVETQILD